MANYGPNIDGYVLVGIANDKADADKISKNYSITPTIYNKFYITGVQSEAEKYYENMDRYYQYIIQSIDKEPIAQGIKDEISSRTRLIKYYDKAVLVFHIRSGTSPIMYNKKYYIRKGPNVFEVEPEGYEALFRKFLVKETS